MATQKRHKICIFGVFGSINIGNDSTLEAMFRNVLGRFPGATITCVCMNPSAIKKEYNIDAVSMTGTVVKPGLLGSSALARALRKLVIGIPTELYRWYEAFRFLKGVTLFVVPGTGLLNDAWGIMNWGPYTLFKWSLMAKLRRGRVLFVSVGAGPLYSSLGRWLVKSSLGMASFRSYRDQASKEYLIGAGFPAASDAVYPDLAFSLQAPAKESNGRATRQRGIVGIGLMGDAGRYSRADPDNATFPAYLDTLACLGEWVLAHDYDIRLLIGDYWDRPVKEEWKSLLARRLVTDKADRILDEPDVSVEEFLSQLTETRFVVATRFHNVLLSLLCNKPVIAISFHHKCSSLMEMMGLSEYCMDISRLDSIELLDKVCALERNAEELSRVIESRVGQCREALEEQCEKMFSSL